MAVNLVGSAGTNFLVAGAGNETLNASGATGANWMSMGNSAGANATRMIGGSGADTLIAGAALGSATMTGGAGADAFVFFKQAAGGANDLITDFSAQDSVYILGYDAGGSASQLQAAATVSSAGVVLTLNDGTKLTFSNLTSVDALNGKILYT